MKRLIARFGRSGRDRGTGALYTVLFTPSVLLLAGLTERHLHEMEERLDPRSVAHHTRV